MNWIEQYPFIAHRGLHGKGVPENSELSFEQAIKNNYAIELDIQFLSDQTPIVFHDDNLLRMTGESCQVKNLNPVFLRHIRYQDGQRILTFADCLKVVDAKVPLLIEVKNDTYSKLGLNQLLKELSCYRGKYSIQSFNPQILSYLNFKAPHISIGQLKTDWGKTDLNFFKRNYLRFSEFYNDLSFISVDQKIISQFDLLISKNKNIPLLTWTIKSSKDLLEVQSKCHGFIFEGFLP